MYGEETISKHGVSGVDLLKEAMDSNAPSQWLILKIRDSIYYEGGYSPEIKILRTELSGTDASYLKKGYADLLARNLVVRTKMNHYMINPDGLIPSDYDLWKEVWDKAKAKAELKASKYGKSKKEITNV